MGAIAERGMALFSEMKNFLLLFLIALLPLRVLALNEALQHVQGTPNVIGTTTGLIDNTANVRMYGALGDGTTDDTVACQAAITAMISAGGGQVYFPAGTYIVTGLTLRGNNVAIVGAGSPRTTIRRKSSSASSNVLEIGNLALGNSAPPYTNLTVRGLTIDGNKANVSEPSSDMTDWGLSFTNCAYCKFSDIHAINCWNGGVGVFINSNYCIGEAYVYNSGAGNLSTGTEEGFDINSSKYGQFKIISDTCQNGARFLDNCFGNIIDAVIYNATTTGFICNNQTINQSYGNTLRLSVIGGCSAQAVLVTANCRNNFITAAIEGVGGYGINEPLVGAPNTPEGNTYVVNSYLGQIQSCYIGGNSGIWTINTDRDGRGGSQGSTYAVDVNGNNNVLHVNLTDTSTWQVRGVVMRSGATENTLASYNYTNTADPYDDSGTRSKCNPGNGPGVTIASASTITIPPLGSVFLISGTNGITTINTAWKGVFTLLFQGTLTVTSGSNLKLSANFSAQVNRTLTLYSDGTNCYEISRSLN